MPRKITPILITGMLLAVVVAIVYVLLSAASGPGKTNQLERFATGPLERLDFAYAGEVPAETVFVGPDNAPLTLSDLQGKVILVNLWATWCGPCEREMPSLGALQTARGGDAFEVIAISVDNDEDKSHAADQLARWTGASLGLYHTSEFALAYELGATVFPTSILYDRHGREIARYVGDLDWSSLEVVALVDALIASADTP